MARDQSLVRREPPRLIAIQNVVSGFGRLGVIESQTHSPFDYARFYFMTDLPLGARRGGHAHKTLRQVIVCLRGTATIDIRSAEASQRFRLDRCDQAIVLPAGYWRDLHGFSDDALVGVLASDRYDEADYIRDWDEYESWDRVRWDGANWDRPGCDRPGWEPSGWNPSGWNCADGGRAAPVAATAAVAPVPYLDLARYVPLVGQAVSEAVDRVLRSGWLIGGTELTRFEQAFATYCGTSHGVGVGNGLQALTLALRAAGIGPDDEVILPANSFIATALAVVEAGAVPVLVDVEPATGLIDPSAVAAAITPRTRAIIPVHLYGHPADMDALRWVADEAVARSGKAPLFLLEDACQAHGARYKGRRCGSLGDAAAFSFYPTKNLGAVGDAGAVVTADAALAARLRQLGDYGSASKYQHLTLGTNSRLDPVQAAALGVKLPHLDAWNEIRAGHAAHYFAALRGIEALRLPVVHPWADPVWHIFAVRVAASRRDELRDALHEQGIGTGVHYPTPIHLQPCFAGRWNAGCFPVAERLAGELVSLPLDATHSTEEIAHVADTIRAFFRARPSRASVRDVAAECPV